MQIWLEDKLEIVDGLAEIIDNVQEIEDYIPKNISEVKIKKLSTLSQITLLA